MASLPLSVKTRIAIALSDGAAHSETRFMADDAGANATALGLPVARFINTSLSSVCGRPWEGIPSPSGERFNRIKVWLGMSFQDNKNAQTATYYTKINTWGCLSIEIRVKKNYWPSTTYQYMYLPKIK